VGDPTPVITGVNPNNWPAGAQTSFTITGSGFGTAPTLSVTGNGVTGSAITSSTDTQINATVTIAANAPSGIATITVTSTGYLGSGFVSTGGSGGSTNSATANASISTTQGVNPTIVWGPDSGGGANCGGTNIAGTQQNVVVGQQIAFTACFPQGETITSEMWSPTVPPGTVVSGYNASTAGGCVVSFGQTTCGTPPSTGVVCGTSSYCDFPMFYWVDTGGNGQTFTITYQYTLNGTNYTGSAPVTFNVTGPTPTGPNGTFFTATSGTVNVWPAGVAKGGSAVNPWLEFGNALNNNGMSLQVTATPPNAPPAGAYASFQWVQLIGPNKQQYVTNPATPNGTMGTGLDNWYPYPTLQGDPDQVSDSPGLELIAYDMSHSIIPIGEGAEVFSATMYLMWDPALPGPGQQSCHPASSIYDPISKTVTPTASTCTGSIPVPLAYASWGFGGDAINTLQTQQSTNTTWLLQPCSAPQPSTPTVQSTTAYPTWTNTVQNQN